MIAQFKLTEPPEDLKIPPEQLFQKLLHSAANLDSLVKDLNCSPEDLAETLTDPRTINLLRLKAQLASLQVKLLAIHYMPHAMAQTVKLTEADKPEVARRACNTVINMAGVPTETKSQPPTLTLDKQEELQNDSLTSEEKHHIEIEQEEAGRIWNLLAFGQHFQKLGVDIKDLERCNSYKLAEVLNALIAEEAQLRTTPQPPPQNPA